MPAPGRRQANSCDCLRWITTSVPSQCIGQFLWLFAVYHNKCSLVCSSWGVSSLQMLIRVCRDRDKAANLPLFPEATHVRMQYKASFLLCPFTIFLFVSTLSYWSLLRRATALTHATSLNALPSHRSAAFCKSWGASTLFSTYKDYPSYACIPSWLGSQTGPLTNSTPSSHLPGQRSSARLALQNSRHICVDGGEVQNWEGVVLGGSEASMQHAHMACAHGKPHGMQVSALDRHAWTCQGGVRLRLTSSTHTQVGWSCASLHVLRFIKPWSTRILDLEAEDANSTTRCIG